MSLMVPKPKREVVYRGQHQQQQFTPPAQNVVPRNRQPYQVSYYFFKGQLEVYLNKGKSDLLLSLWETGNRKSS